MPRPAHLLLLATLLAAPAHAQNDPQAADATGPREPGFAVLNENGWTIRVGADAALGLFRVGNVDFGVGHLNTADNGLHRNRNWIEGFAKPWITITWDRRYAGQVYFRASAIGAFTNGQGDALSSLAPQGARSGTSDRPEFIGVEDAVGGWRSGEAFPSLGRDAIDISGGYQGFVIGDGLVIGDGTVDGFGRAIQYLGSRGAFRDTVILRFDPSELAPVRGALFHLRGNTNQRRMRNFDQADTYLIGGMAEWYGAARPEREGELCEQRHWWCVTGTALHVYRADRNVNLGFSGANDNSAGASATGNRHGLSVFSIRVAGSFFDDRDILLWSEFVYQHNDRARTRVRAYGFYGEGGYRFSAVPWKPTLTYRFTLFSGDRDTTDRTDRSYDPLFFSGSARGVPGTWNVTEIYGQYMAAPTNLVLHRFSLRVDPLDNLGIGLLYYLADFHRPQQFGATRHGAFHEVNVFAEWKATDWLTVVPTLGFAVARSGYRQIVADQRNQLQLPPGGARTIGLAQIVAGVKF